MAKPNHTNLSDEDPTKLCDPCLFRGINTQAGSYCQVCLDYLCISCEEFHRSSKASRDHELKPFKETQTLSIKQKALISSIMACDIHRTETLTLFCESHNIAVCNVCNSVKHRKCNTKALKQVSKEENIKADVTHCLEKSKELLSNLKETKESMEKENSQTVGSSSKSLKEVEIFKGEMISWVETLAKDMKEKITDTQRELLVEREGDINAVVEMSKQTENIIYSFETLGKTVEDAAFILMIKEKGNIDEGIEMRDELLTQAKPLTLEFQKCDKLVTLMSEITAIGALKVKEKKINKPRKKPVFRHCFQHISYYNQDKKEECEEDDHEEEEEEEDEGEDEVVEEYYRDKEEKGEEEDDHEELEEVGEDEDVEEYHGLFS